MPLARVSSKGSIVIPQEFRKKYGISPASRVEVLDIGGRVMILPIPPDPVRAARGLLKFHGSVLKTLRKFRHEEHVKESRQFK